MGGGACSSPHPKIFLGGSRYPVKHPLSSLRRVCPNASQISLCSEGEREKRSPSPGSPRPLDPPPKSERWVPPRASPQESWIPVLLFPACPGALVRPAGRARRGAPALDLPPDPAGSTGCLEILEHPQSTRRWPRAPPTGPARHDTRRGSNSRVSVLGLGVSF